MGELTLSAISEFLNRFRVYFCSLYGPQFYMALNLGNMNSQAIEVLSKIKFESEITGL